MAKPKKAAKQNKMEEAAKVWMRKINRAKKVKEEWYKQFNISKAYA